MLRHADADRDAGACAAIYAPFVAGTVVSFELEPPGAEEMARRVAEISTTHPWLVVEQDGRVAGFAYGSPHRTRGAYRWATDVAVYVNPACHRRGLGRQLYQALFDLLRQQGFHVACAGVTLPNEASVGLHEALGFEPVGVYRNIGYKQGAWRDVGWWQLQLIMPDGAPTEILPPQQLSEPR